MVAGEGRVLAVSGRDLSRAGVRRPGPAPAWVVRWIRVFTPACPGPGRWIRESTPENVGEFGNPPHDPAAAGEVDVAIHRAHQRPGARPNHRPTHGTGSLQPPNLVQTGRARRRDQET